MNTSEILWYEKPAENWDQALPTGSGRLGAMAFGGTYDEHIWLNEDSIWSGGPRDRVNPSAFENLQKVRELLLDEKIPEAEEIVRDAFCGTPVNQRHYMLLGELVIQSPDRGEVTDYRRSLDISQAVCKTEFTAGGVRFTREIIASCPDEAVLVNISADKEKSVDLKIFMNDGRDDYYDFNAPVKDDTIFYNGGMGGEGSLCFSSAVMVRSKGGKVKAYGSSLVCTGCDQVTVAVTCRTSYRHKDHKELCLKDAEKVLAKNYEDVKKAHIADYRSFYDRCRLDLCDNSGGSAGLPTDKRLENVRNGGEDNKLAELYFNFGKYLMISGSRPGTLPLNLQGIWNDRPWPAWGCKFTININTEMNYWPAEIWGFSELHQPLFDLIEKMRPSGRETARKMYGCSGFMCHHNTDLWGDTAPQDLWMPGTQWPMGAAWLCLHIWEHYKFTLDKEFLAEKFDTLKEAAEFFVDFLIEDKKGRLVTCPSVSPENTYLTGSGTQGSVCAGSSMDSQILHELFTAVIQSGAVLGRDREFCQKLEDIRERLPKPEIGKYGQIMEWAEDYDEVEPGHRHISQLFALYPADMISPRRTPELAAAARATLERRLSHGGGHTGWSRAWIINHWARLLDGEKVGENISALLSNSTSINMFDMHPPFQIDGNFGGAAGIAEALIQSSCGELRLLGAIPPQWSEGSFQGLRARGGFSVSASWKGGKPVKAEILSLCGETCHVVSDELLSVKCAGENVPVRLENGVCTFETEKGKTYSIE